MKPDKQQSKLSTKAKQEFEKYKKQNNRIQASDLSKIFEALDFDYDRLNYKVREYIQSKTSLNLQQFQEIAGLFINIDNKLENQFCRGWLQIVKLNSQLKDFLSKRNLTVSDRGAQGKIIVQIGPEKQKYNNSFKVWAKKILIKQIKQVQITQKKRQVQNQAEYSNVPSLIIQFYTKDEQSKPKLSQLFQKIYENLKQMIDPDSPLTYLFNLIKFVVRPSQKGVEIVLTFPSKNLQKIFVVASKALQDVLNTKVTAQIAASINFDQNLIDLFGSEAGGSLFNVILQNFRLEICASFSSIMTVIKQMIIQAEVLNELKYEFTASHWLILLLTNTELAQIIVEFNNAELKPQQIQQLKQIQNKLYQKIQKVKQVGSNALVQLQDMFHFQKIASCIGDQIHIKASGWDLSIGVDIKIMGLNGILAKLFAWAKKHDKENQDYQNV